MRSARRPQHYQMNTLPPEVKLSILSMLDLPTLAVLATTTRELSNLTLDNEAWHHRVLDRFGRVPLIGTWSKTYEWYSTPLYEVIHVAVDPDYDPDIISGVFISPQEAFVAAFHFYLLNCWPLKDDENQKIYSLFDSENKTFLDVNETIDLSGLTDTQIRELRDLMNLRRQSPSDQMNWKKTETSLKTFQESEIGRMYINRLKDEFLHQIQSGDLS